MKLRAFLTIAGIVIAIGAFVAMLSFGAGAHQRITTEFEELGLFHTMTVQPAEEGAGDAEEEPLPIDEAAVERFAALPGVRLAYPFESFSAEAALGDTTLIVEAQSLPVAATETPLFSRLAAGAPFRGDESSQVLVTEELLGRIDEIEAEEVIGRPLVLTVHKVSLDSAIVRVLNDSDGAVGEALARVQPDSLFEREYRWRLIREALRGAAERFVDGIWNGREVVRETLTVCGVVRGSDRRGLRPRPILLPKGVARRLGERSIPTDPTAILTVLSSGGIDGLLGGAAEGAFPRVTLDLDPRANHDALTDSIETMGYRAYSYAQQFDEIRRVFLFFEAGLAAVGLIALVTASLGIMNTLIMSVTERRREIGVLKSLGADEGEIRNLFLAESAMIGAVGSFFGLLLGWAVARIASLVIQEFMRREGVPPLDLFATPPWLVLLALVVGIGVSLVAGSLPARRAARVDPVEALRGES